MPTEIYAALLGALVGALITYWFAVKLIERQHANDLRLYTIETRRIAAATFRAAFAPTLAFIYIARHHGTYDRPDIDAHMKMALLLHGTAIEMFRPFVASKDQAGYQDAWEKYRKLAAMGHEDRTSEEWGENIDGHEVLFEEAINSLLGFADA